MEREIKFRAWDINEAEMLYDDKCLSIGADGNHWQYADQGYLINNKEDEPDEFVLMQFTGLKDKNGVEVYEGDIVSWRNAEWVGKVGWCQGDCSFIAYSFDDTDTSWMDDTCEIIGNIYQNPELLK